MRILFVNQTYLPDVAATAQYLGDLARALAAEGHEVTVVCARRGYLNNQNYQQPREVLDGVQVLRAPAFELGKANRVFRMISAFTCNLSLCWRLLRTAPADCIVALTSPPLIAWFALLPARLKGAALLYWVMDVNPEQAVRAGWLRRGSPAERLLRGALRSVLKRASAVVALDRYMADTLRQVEAHGAPIEVLPLWDRQYAARETLQPAAAAFRARHGLQEKFVVMYAGNHSVCHPLDTVLDAAVALRARQDVVFVFIGGGIRADDVARRRAGEGLENILQLPYLNEEEIEGALAAADLQLVVLGAPFVGIVHPSKIYRILALGCPFAFIGPEESAIGRLIAEKQVGVRIEHGDPDALVQEITRLQQREPSERHTLHEQIRSVGKAFDREVTLRALMERITSGGSS